MTTSTPYRWFWNTVRSSNFHFSCSSKMFQQLLSEWRGKIFKKFRVKSEVGRRYYFFLLSSSRSTGIDFDSIFGVLSKALKCKYFITSIKHEAVLGQCFSRAPIRGEQIESNHYSHSMAPKQFRRVGHHINITAFPDASLIKAAQPLFGYYLRMTTTS